MAQCFFVDKKDSRIRNIIGPIDLCALAHAKPDQIFRPLLIDKYIRRTSRVAIVNLIVFMLQKYSRVMNLIV